MFRDTWQTSLARAGGLLTEARAGVSIGLAVYFSALAQQNLFNTFGPFLGMVIKMQVVLS